MKTISENSHGKVIEIICITCKKPATVYRPKHPGYRGNCQQCDHCETVK